MNNEAMIQEVQPVQESKSLPLQAKPKREVHLLAHRVGQSRLKSGHHGMKTNRGCAATPGVVVIPEGICTIDPSADDGNELPTIRRDPEDNAGLVLETFVKDGQPRTLLLPRVHEEVRINGARVVSVSVLREGDEIQWNNDVVFQVAIFHRPQIGAPTSEQVGKKCPICTVQFTASTRVYVCPGCNGVMHLEENADGLQCARLSRSCTCGRSIEFEEGYSRTIDW
jgi:hypothetical protein